MKHYILILILLSSFIAKSQNTFQYENIEKHYRNGLELFDRKNYTASKEEFKQYLIESKNLLGKNEYNIVSAKYYLAVTGLYENALDAEVEVERFVIDHGDHPKAKSIYLDMGNYYFDQGNYSNAITYLEKSVGFSNLVESNYKLGMAYYLTKNTKKALAQFNIVKKQPSEYANTATYYAAVIEYEENDNENAVADFKKLENVAAYKNDVPNWIANILFRQKKFDELLAFTEPILANPQGRKLDDISLLTAEVNYQKGNYSKALKYYDQAKNFRKGNPSPEVSFRHGYSQYINGSYAASIENFKKVAASTGSLGQQAAFYLGVASQKSGNLQAAISAFDVARKQSLNPSITEEAAFNYCKVQMQANNATEGVTELAKFIQKYPNSVYEDEANELLSEAYLVSNDYDVAIKYIESLRNKTTKIKEAYQRVTFNKGVEDFNNEKFTNSIINFDKAIMNGSDAYIKNTSTYWKAEALLANKQTTEAQNTFQSIYNSATDDLKFKAQYALGYLAYNAKDFPKAIQIFEDYTKNVPRQDQFRLSYDDANLRIADSYLTQKKYDNALQYYNLVIEKGKNEKDYALYQKGMILIFTGKNQEAKGYFDDLARSYPNSRYTDDSWYQSGVLELEKGNYQQAITLLSRVITEKPKSNIVPNALSKRAVAYFNIKNHEASIKDYLRVLQQYPTSDVAEESLIGIQEEYNAVGRPEDFQRVLADYKQKNPENGTAIALEFESAKGLYLNEKYQQAIVALTNYIKNNPQTSQAAEAKFYIGDSYYRLGNKENAINYYYQVIAENKTTYVSRAAYRAGEIEFANKKYNAAITNYRLVLNTSQNKKDAIVSWSAMMESYFNLQKYDSASFFAKEIISNGNLVTGVQNKATLYQAKILAAKNDPIGAEAEFRKLLTSNDAYGAEALYSIGELQYKQRKFDESIKTLQAFNNSFGDYTNWYEAAFLLIADDYVGKEDYFMAKATLKSIIDNTSNQDLKAKANVKLKAIENKQ
jgi:tetratricopeptide (TPR) repeat protein